MKRYVYKLQRFLAKRKGLVKAIIKLRNQCNIIIGLSLAPDHIFEATGEADFLQTYKGKVKTFFDIGANMGEWTEEMLKLNPAAKGILMEPNPDCMQTLRTKFSTNENINILEVACSEQPGRASFFAEHGGGETSSLSNAGTYGARKIDVEVTTIDRVVTERNISNIDYLKVDVEGFDMHVLKGAKNTLEKKMIDTIQFEYNRTWRNNGSTLTYAFAYLQQFGYKTYCLKKSGLTAFDPESYMEYFAYSNFIAIRQR